MKLNNYSFEFTPNETCAGGTLLYIANHLSYKCRNDLNIYKKNELESTFMEIANPKKSNIIEGVIYRHLSMDLTEFNCNYLKLVSAIFYQMFIFSSNGRPSKTMKSFFFISSKKLFLFSRYSNFSNFFPSFPHFPVQKGK